MKLNRKKYANGSSGIMSIDNLIYPPTEDPKKKTTKTATKKQVDAMNVNKDFAGLEVTQEFGQSGYFITEEEQAN